MCVISVAVKLSITNRRCIRECFRRGGVRGLFAEILVGGGVRYLPPHPRLYPCFERSPASIYSSPTMFGSIPNYFYERRNGLLRATGYAGATYLVTSYVKEQLQDVKDEVLLRRKAREK